MKKTTLIFAFIVLLGALSLGRASAQLGPPPPPLVPSAGIAAAPVANRTTTVVQIYHGSGSFDDAMAEKLRPMLAKGYPFSVPETTKAAPRVTNEIPAKSENQKKLAQATP